MKDYEIAFEQIGINIDKGIGLSWECFCLLLKEYRQWVTAQPDALKRRKRKKRRRLDLQPAA